MKRMDVDEQSTRSILKYLEESHLVEYTTAYKLSSDSLRPSIQQWRDQRAGSRLDVCRRDALGPPGCS